MENILEFINALKCLVFVELFSELKCRMVFSIEGRIS